MGSPVAVKIVNAIIFIVVWGVGIFAWLCMLGAAGFFILLILRAIFG